MEKYLNAIEVFVNNFCLLLGVKTIRHQSFTILSSVFVRKHPMIIVNFNEFDNLIKIAAENSYSVLPLIIRTFPCSQTSRKSWRSFSKIQNHTHTLLHKPAFILKYFSNKLTETPFDGYFLITWLNEPYWGCRLQPVTLLKLTLLHGCFSRFLNCTNKVPNRATHQKYLLLLDNDSFAASHSDTFLWMPTM